ncbi:hypothetical protein MAR_006827 [Mya arenaria]|uniref:EF-hand domain-containing protein n=1 Tax=Mya arenaria TaxID=6604 RepID=A0ABY7DCN9_MYAAR|nr:hypothetical protein MAR_006827 [Mya arenaria]
MSLTKQECEDFWSKADKNGDGQLTIQELDKALRSILPPGKGPSSKDVVIEAVVRDSGAFKGGNVKEITDDIMKEADTSGDGAVDLQEFLKIEVSSTRPLETIQMLVASRFLGRVLLCFNGHLAETDDHSRSKIGIRVTKEEHLYHLTTVATGKRILIRGYHNK